MARNPGKFRGAGIQPVGAGKMQAQGVRMSPSDRKSAILARDLERFKAERIATQVYIEAVSSPYEVQPADDVIFCNTNGGTVDVELPAVVGQNGRLLTIKKVTPGATAVRIFPASSETIDGGSSPELDGADRGCVQLRCDEPRSDWRIVAQVGTVTP